MIRPFALPNSHFSAFIVSRIQIGTVDSKVDIDMVVSIIAPKNRRQHNYTFIWTKVRYSAQLYLNIDMIVGIIVTKDRHGSQHNFT